MTTHFEKILLLLSVIVLATGCIKEDLDDCEKTRLSFIYKGDGEKDIFQSKINNVELYVFDKQNHLITTRTLTQKQLKKRQGINLNIPSGQYSLVAIGNAGERTTVKDIQCRVLKNIMLMHPKQGVEKIPGHDPLYMGKFSIEIVKDRWQDEIIEFKSSHLKVSVEVKGIGFLPKSRAPIPSLSLQIKNVYPHTNFTNEGCGEFCSLHPELIVKDESHVAFTHDLNVFRYKKQCSMTIELVNQEGQIIVSQNVAEFLAKHPEVDIFKQEALLPILIEFTPTQIEIRLPEWYIQDITPDFN